MDTLNISLFSHHCDEKTCPIRPVEDTFKNETEKTSISQKKKVSLEGVEVWKTTNAGVFSQHYLRFLIYVTQSDVTKKTS